MIKPTVSNATLKATLNSASLTTLAERGIRTPSYPRGGLVGVVHLGLGAFQRAHQAIVFDALLHSGDKRWGVLGVAMHNPAVADALKAQDGLYAVQIASSAGTHWQVPGAIWHTCVAAREAQQVIDALAAPTTRWVTLTVTEKGYGPELAALLVRGLAARRAAGLGGLTLASCDNLSENGRKLEALCVATAQSTEHEHAGLADWIPQACTFPNSMVDRIVPAATPERLQSAAQALGLNDHAALGTEAFWEWVIERRFVDASDAGTLAAAGVTVVDDVRPFETAKLRLLNGSHTAMACLGAVAGLPVISDCIAQPAVRQFIHRLMTEEVGPQLQRQDWPQYRDALLERFANPALQHSVHQIATDCSQKIPQRWPASALGVLHAHRMPECLAFAAAVWLRYLRAVDDQGTLYQLNDPMATELHALALEHAANATATVQALCTLPTLWGDALPRHAAWLARIAHWLSQINRHGVIPALTSFNALDSLNTTTP